MLTPRRPAALLARMYTPQTITGAPNLEHVSPHNLSKVRAILKVVLVCCEWVDWGVGGVLQGRVFLWVHTLWTHAAVGRAMA